jgi:hypothetical protein
MAATSAPAGEYLAAPNRVVSAANGIEYAYREVGDGAPALVLFQHFRGNLDNWDPAMIDALARGRRVITFDNRGVAGSSATTPSTIAQMALDAIDFIDALGVGEVDLLGFSTAASWPRRSLSCARRRSAGSCSPLPLRRERAACTAGHRR